MISQCKSILVAEDNDDIRETITDVLRGEGYQVDSAKNGKIALQKLSKLPSPSLVLLDLMMPVMSGWEFLDAQRKSAVFAPHQVVVISALGATKSLEDSTPLETAGSLPKPIALDALLSKVREFCGPGMSP